MRWDYGAGCRRWWFQPWCFGYWFWPELHLDRADKVARSWSVHIVFEFENRLLIVLFIGLFVGLLWYSRRGYVLHHKRLSYNISSHTNLKFKSSVRFFRSNCKLWHVNSLATTTDRWTTPMWEEFFKLVKSNT